MWLWIILFYTFFIIKFLYKRKGFTYIFNISEEIKKLDTSIFNHSFWKFIKDYNFDFFGILDPKNGFQEQYPISSVFNFLHNDNNYCIYYTKNVFVLYVTNLQKKLKIWIY